jgi:hypothetical protein
LDASGTVLRTYASTDPVTPTPEELRTNLIPPYWPLRHGPLPNTAGMHRWVWDLRSTAPASPQYAYPISAVPGRTPLVPEGPLVLPGTYNVKLTVDGQSETQPLTVKMDPRIHTSPADLEALHTAELAMYATLDSVAKADLAAHSVEEQVDAAGNASIETQLATYKAALKKLLEGNEHDGGEATSGQAGQQAEKPAPGLDGVTAEAGQLYGELDQADEPATETLLHAASQVEDEGKDVVPAWEQFAAQQIPAIDEVLRKAGRPEINPEKKATDMPEAGDED